MDDTEILAGRRSRGGARANADSHHNPRRHTRFAVGLLAVWGVALAVAACGGTARNHYASAVKRQETCCDRVGDPDAAAVCRAEVRRVDRPGDENDPMNQQTYYCIDRHFVCEARTGKATPASAQHQLDCINDAETAGR